MTVLPANVARVPNLLRSQLTLSNLGRTNLALLGVQTQMATGRSINRPSDDSVRASAIGVLDQRLAQGEQRTRNISHASAVLGTLDSSMTDVTNLVRQASTVASDQVGITSDATTRSQQAVVIDSLLRQLTTIANRSTSGVYVFGGSSATRPPLEQTNNGYRYTGRGAGLLTDLGSGSAVPITIGGDNAIGEISSRQRSTGDLNPALTAATKLADVLGARGQGVAGGSVSFSFNGGPTANVDLTGAQSVQDVLNRLTVAVRDYETTNSVTVLGPGGISLNGGSLSFDIAAGGSLAFTDTTNGVTGADLGLTAAAFTSTNPSGGDLDPRLTLSTPLASVAGLTLPLGSIRLRLSSGATSTVRDVDLSGATTFDDVRNAIESTNLGVRVRVNENGRGLSIFNEVAGPSLSIEEAPGGADTATELGIRSLSASTVIADFNNGRGVGIVNGSVDPVTGLPDPARDTDFRVTLGNGQAFDVDLRPQDMVSVQTVLNRINQEFTTAIGLPPINSSAPALVAGQFTAQLTSGANGIAFTQTVGPGSVVVESRNNSPAAADLGLLNGTYDVPSATLVAQDRAGIRVNNLFSDLIDLRDALLGNNTTGISLAGESLGRTTDRVSAAHGLVASYAQQVDQAGTMLESQTTMDSKLKSELGDLDFAAAATQFSLLQTQLQASLQTAGQFNSRTLLDFLG